MGDLTDRYRELGGKYATDEYDRETDLPINSCMNRDNLQECYEEMVDAVFNCLVYIYRNPELTGGHALLGSLLACVGTLESERISDGANLRG